MLTRREILLLLGKGAAACPLASFLSCGGEKAANSPATPPPPTLTMTDDQLLDQIERASFQFFWEQASPATGIVKDRARADGTENNSTVGSIASTGYALAALCIADSRGYAQSQQIKERVAATLRYLATQAFQENGFFYHFIDINSGARVWNCELSSIDTAILLCGVLTARAHFNDATIADLATQIYERVNWPWMLNGETTFSMGWKPESGFLPDRWSKYSELMMLYLLAIGSPSHPVPASCWDAWTRDWYEYQGHRFITSNWALFTYQFSHAWFDFRGKKDAYANYFDNSVSATQAHKLFCLSLAGTHPDYSDKLWGITSSDSANGYVGWGGPPAFGPIDGTVVPCAAGGSLPFVPADCLRVLHTIREQYGDRAWKKYGFVDAFNPLTGWYDPDVVGIDAGITMLMAENYRSQFVWRTFMSNPEPGVAMGKVGFQVQL